ncbi:DNA ligase D [Altererythrobacter xixiisoli]|uniref:DNA ligase (ATP) n=1 Tax=Croceibacterium xixiisoli TaxID=1476466 RepID=A0A6I4TVU2_9SPHN|nr:DNA ligase D [Croceibacterium xixiisoli]MXO99942.1 DNA ligase D [Croceibacterium xixiisoli]
MVSKSTKTLLAEYNRKRDFSKTGEPKGTPSPSTGKRIFIVQKHAASRLHWDFRLEIDGVLKSWAVTKGPSSDPDIKRLAVRTEDHPMAYAEFEGTIPKGEYGGGSVMLWDSGTWAPVPGKDASDVERGHLHFTLDGERMKGEWLLVRMKPRAGEKRENWLLRKVEDQHSLPGDTLVEQGLTSVLTGRSMAQIAGDPDAEHALEGKSGKAFAREMASAARHNRKTTPKRASARRSTPQHAPPPFRAPQLATLVDAVPAGNDWLHEIKFDGYRTMIATAADKVAVFTRSGKDWTDKFAPLARAIAELDLPACLIDGEIVAYDAQGNPDFSTLQGVLKRGHGAQAESDRLALHAFDLLHLNGDDLTGLPLIERKERLAALLQHAVPPIHVADHVIGLGEKLYRQMCDAGQEGIISKRIDSRYREGRGSNWVKVKCTRRQEFVIVGWTKSSARGRPFASIVLAQNEGGSLVYKGKVGTGFDEATLTDLAGRFARIERKTAPVEVARAEARGVSWITPKLVAEVAFAEFTADGHIRHGSFLGLRSDKPAREVAPERPEKLPAPEPGIAITNRDRVIFPDDGYTKGQLAEYYTALAPLMLPFLAQRPISLVRCPQGRAKKCFFQKHDSGSFGEEVHHVPIREKDGGVEDYLYVESSNGMLACVQMGTIEFHGWCSRSDEVEHPDRMIFDLDPDEGLDFGDVRQAALDIRARLADLGLASFAMLSGGKGVHVVVPLSRGHGWDAHKDFAKRFAEAMSVAEPDRFVATMSKAKRKGKIFIDWLRNQRGSTAIMPYAVRARAGAPVAVPISWKELPAIDSANIYTMSDAETLLERAQGKALAGWGMAEQQLPDI